MMSKISAIRSALSSANKVQQTMFAVACAERCAVVFRRLAAPASVAVFNAALDASWNAVKADGLIASEQQQSLSALPEATIDDSDLPEHYATFAVGILEYALDSFCESKTARAADFACCQTIDLYASFDAIAIGCPNKIVNPDCNPEYGPLASSELAEQLAVMRALNESSEGRPELCDYIRERALSASRVLDSAIAALINRRTSSTQPS